MLGITPDLIDDPAEDMRRKDGIISIIDAGNDDEASTIAFTRYGLNALAQALEDRQQP